MKLSMNRKRNIQGDPSEKTDIYTGEVLEDAEFTVLQWNRGKQTYQNDLGVQSILKFDIETGWYSTEELVLTDDNQGRFKVVETKNPENYTGKYEKEVIFQKKENTDTDTVDLKAENTPVTLPLGNITIIKKIKEEDITWLMEIQPFPLWQKVRIYPEILTDMRIM